MHWTIKCFRWVYEHFIRAAKGDLRLRRVRDRVDCNLFQAILKSQHRLIEKLVDAGARSGSRLEINAASQGNGEYSVISTAVEKTSLTTEAPLLRNPGDCNGITCR